MSDLSKFIPKKYQKKSVEDQMIKPIASLNVANNSVNPSLPTTNGQLNQNNASSNISLPKLPNQTETPSTNSVSNPVTTSNPQPNNNFNPPNNNDVQEKNFKKSKVKKSSQKKKTTLLLLLLLFFLVAGGAGLFLVKQRQDTREEAYGADFSCSSINYGSICLNRPSNTWNGRCVLIYCPKGIRTPGKCSESDPNAYWKFGNCSNLLNEGRYSPDLRCWQVDAVDNSNVYCQVEGCDSEETDLSACGTTTFTPTRTPTNTPTPRPTNRPTNTPTPSPTDTPTPTPTGGLTPTNTPTPSPTDTPTPTPTGGLTPTNTPTPTDTPIPTDTPTPTPTEPPPPTEYPRISCSATGCVNDNQCQEGLVCVDIGNTGICSLPELTDLCAADRNYEACCTGYTPAPTATITSNPTSTPTTEPTTPPATPTPVITTVITTVGCNESCNENADCSNISHICYEGMCRLDVNPTDVNCRLPDGGNVIERAVEVPTVSGFADWFNFIKVGFGILGLGSLLLLLL